MSAPAALSGPIERAGGFSAADCSQLLERLVCAPEGPQAPRAVRAAVARLRVLVPHVGSIDDGPVRACFTAGGCWTNLVF